MTRRQQTLPNRVQSCRWLLLFLYYSRAWSGVTQQSMSLEYESSSEPLHISAEQKVITMTGRHQILFIRVPSCRQLHRDSVEALENEDTLSRPTTFVILSSRIRSNPMRGQPMNRPRLIPPATYGATSGPP